MKDVVTEDSAFFDSFSETLPLDIVNGRILLKLNNFVIDPMEIVSRRARVPISRQVALHSRVAKLQHCLGGDAFDGLCPGGLIAAHHGHEWHFSCRDRQGDAHREMYRNPREGEVHIQIDFSENLTLPVGPSESQEWFFAGSRVSVSCLAAVCWRKGMRPRTIVYMSDILEKTPRLVCSILQALLEDHILDMGDGCTKLHLWCDTGTHFRCYQLLWFVTHFIPLISGWTRARPYLHFFAEHHGKGLCDSEFAVVKHSMHLASCSKLLSTLDDLIAIEFAAADKARESNDITPCRRFIKHEPDFKIIGDYKTFKQSCFQIPGLRITSSYSYSSTEEQLMGERIVKVHSHCFTNHPIVQSIRPVVIAEKCDPSIVDWRKTWRDTVPEKEPPQFNLLVRKYREQHQATHPIVWVGERMRPMSVKANGWICKMRRAAAVRAATHRVGSIAAENLSARPAC
jgi:hypothetical protein